MDTSDIANEIQEALEAHAAWKTRLRLAAKKNETDIPVKDIGRDDNCRFGHWLQKSSFGAAHEAHLSKIREHHRKFHLQAGSIASLISRGETEKALSQIEAGPFVDASKLLGRSLMEWKREL